MSQVLEQVRADQILAATRALVQARETNLGIEVDLPILYPDGRSVTVVVEAQGNGVLIHDAGFGMMQLTLSGVRPTETLRARFLDVAARFGCSFEEGRVVRRCRQEQASVALVLVGNASRSIADFATLVRRRGILDFKQEVSGIAAATFGDPERVQNDQEVVGDSGTSYRLNIIILNEEKAAPIAYIETIADQNTVNSRFRTFFDIAQNDNLSAIPRVAIYDDRHDWRAGDLVLLQNVSNVVPFSGAKNRLDRLAG
jgi:hypothetical protein